VGNRADVVSARPVDPVDRTPCVRVPQAGRRAVLTEILTVCPMEPVRSVVPGQEVQGGVAAGMNVALDPFGGPVAGQAEARAVLQDGGGAPVRTTRAPMQLTTQGTTQATTQAQTRVRTLVQTGFHCAVQVVGPLVGPVVGPVAGLDAVQGVDVARTVGRSKGQAQRVAISHRVLHRRLAKPPRGPQSGERLRRLAVTYRVHSLHRWGLLGRQDGVGVADVMGAVGADRAFQGDPQAMATGRAIRVLRADQSAMAGPDSQSVKHARHGRRGPRVRQDRRARTVR